MAKADFDAGRQAHAEWLGNFKALITSKSKVEPDTISNVNSTFGKWYYSEGKEKYGSSKSMQDIEYQNKKLHQLANDIYSMQLAGDESLPDWLTDELNTTSAKIIDLLNKSEQE